ncbi:SWI/SNF complex subunit SWI3C [Heracleum sosnowskyi]|uniref:SWI/SNF complex subunit SWI3C n=1 Tax=Heracleum sosnowskyi TaxID=360622 RepID=A0AAD8JI51_9APIA|nr:SWI/SNF complex subunit SWI3C [Heracleum sosnowskyi]
MPASNSDTRNRWNKRKREEDLQHDDQISPQFIENQTNYNHSINTSPHPITPELLSDTPIQVSEFPPVVKRHVQQPHSSVIAIVNAERGNVTKCGVSLENVSNGQLQALSVMTKESLVSSEKGEGDCVPYVIKPPMIMKGQGVVKRFGNDRTLVVPMHADWFSPYTVHRLERQVVPHYFSGKSVNHTPKKYMECRNCIVAKYMDNPEKKLARSDCDGLVIGVDNDDMNRIFRFLDHWGIINYCAPALNCQMQDDGQCLNEDSTGELRLPMNLLKSIDSLIQFDRPKCQLSAAEAYPELRGLVHSDFDFDSKIQERLSENRCSCCSRPLPIIYYQSQKEDEVLLCMKCFHEGRFIAGHSSLDFSRFVSSKDHGDIVGENWSDQETLLLLEAMEVYGENWNDIAEHVKTKSKAQCVVHFLSFPMDDSSMKNVEVPHIPISVKLSNNDECDRSHSNLHGHHAGLTLQDTNAESRVPFANYANPVVALVAFLASAVGPRVAAAYAHTTLIELTMDDQVATSDYNITDSSQQEDSTPLSDAKLRAASKAGLSAAATKSKLFANHEEREIQRLSTNIINHQLKRLELKLKQFKEVETILVKEWEQVDMVKQRIAAERAALLSTHFGPGGVTRSTSLSASCPAMINNYAGNTRQQTISDMPSQPYVSSSSNQLVHPHVLPMMSQKPTDLVPGLPSQL